MKTTKLKWSQTVAGRTIIVAGTVSFLCSLLVAASAVGLRARQEINQRQDIEKNVLQAAGQDVASMTTAEFAEAIAEYKPIVFSTLDGCPTDSFTVAELSKVNLFTDEELSVEIPNAEDIAVLKRLPKYTSIYVKGNLNNPENVIFPVRGYGLWGTLIGFLGLKGDLNTVTGLVFFSHKETPGLGGEVDNPKWKAQWVGKKLFADDVTDYSQSALQVVKGKARPNSPSFQSQVDGLSGASLTSAGVSNMLTFWFSDAGYAPIFNCLRNYAEGQLTCGGIGASSCVSLHNIAAVGRNAAGSAFGNAAGSAFGNAANAAGNRTVNSEGL